MQRVWLWSTLVVFVCGSVLAAPLLGRKPTPRFAEFLERREGVYTSLATQFETLPAGFRLTRNNDNPRELLVGKSFQRMTEHLKQQQDWQSRWGYQTFITLEPEALPEGQQGSSETMAATVLLNHLGSGLAKLGFRNQGSPTAAMSSMQRSANIWFREKDPSLEIEINVVVVPSQKQGLVWVTTREAFSR
jgi:hypothetical protein